MFRFHSAVLAALAAIAEAGGFRMEKDDDDDEEEEERSGRRSHDELVGQLEAMMKKRGGGEAAATSIALKLLDDNEKARTGRRKWREKAEALEKVAPKEGQVVLSKEDAAAYETFKALGKPDEVKAKLAKVDTLEAEKLTAERGKTVAKGASLAKLNPDLLARLAEKENFSVELKTEKVDGKDVEVPYAKKNDANAPTLPLAEFAKKELAVYGAALAATGNGQQQQQSTATAFVEQSSSSTAPTGDKVKAFLDQRNQQAAARPNPLAPPAPVKTATSP